MQFQQKQEPAASAVLVCREWQALEQLCRYITRPALANERVQTNAAGQVVLKLKTAWRDGTTEDRLFKRPFFSQNTPRRALGHAPKWLLGAAPAR